MEREEKEIMLSDILKLF